MNRSQSSVSSSLRRSAGALELAPDVDKLVAARAGEAARIGAVAMQLDDALLRHAGGLMQAVDVLRDDGAHAAAGDKPRERAMPAAGFCVRVEIVHDEFPPPGLFAHQRIAKKVGKFDRLVLKPRRTGRAEVRHAAFGRNAGAGEADGPARRADEQLQFGPAFGERVEDHVDARVAPAAGPGGLTNAGSGGGGGGGRADKPSGRRAAPVHTHSCIQAHTHKPARSQGPSSSSAASYSRTLDRWESPSKPRFDSHC